LVKGSDYINETWPWVAEYMNRMRFAKLGWTEPFSELDCLTAEAMILIDTEVRKITSEQMQKPSE